MNKNKTAGFKNYYLLIVMTLAQFSLASFIFSFIPSLSSAVPVFIFFAVVQGLAMLSYILLPLRSKHMARKISMIIIGGTLFFLAGILGRQNFQFEGFVFLVIGGIIGGPVIHFIMKTAGTLLSGRSWCSWGCWTAAVLDFLPFKNNTVCMNESFTKFRYYHAFTSIFIVSALYLLFDYSLSDKSGAGNVHTLYWFVAGNVLYYITAVVLAFKLKDNRAFCKYICPVSILLKISNLFAVLRIKGVSADCSGCRECEMVCPSSILIHDYIKRGERVKSTECMMCLNCVASCPEGNLKTSVGFDIVKIDKLRMFR